MCFEIPAMGAIFDSVSSGNVCKQSGVVRKMRNFDVAGDILDEIALEGLDGVTFKTLLERLRHRHGFGLEIDEHTEQYIWRIVRNMASVKFYVISAERKDIVFPSNLNDEKQLSALAILENTVYPFKLVTTENEIGSCVEYDSRIDATENVRILDLPQVQEKWGSQLVIVADQTCRIKSLCGDNSADHLDIVQGRVLDYGFLEIIGRSRTRGLNCSGPGSAQHMVCRDAKSTHYRAKTLIHKGLIKKLTTARGPKLILTRFVAHSHYESIDYGYRFATEKAIILAKKNPKRLVLRKDVYNLLPAAQNAKRFRSSDIFRKCFRVVSIPYREFYPDAFEKDYLNKSKVEKRLGCFELVNDVIDDEESDEEETTDDPADKDLYMGVPFHNQVYREILKVGSKGISARALRKKFDVSLKTITVALQRLQKDKEVRTFPMDKGRITTFLNAVVSNDSTKGVIQRLQDRLNFMPVKEEVIPYDVPVPIPEEIENDEESIVLTRKTLRTGSILRAIKYHKIMTTAQIYHQILEEEKQQKVKYVMDRKSLKRILNQLVEEGLIKTQSDLKPQRYCDLSYDPNESSDENFSVEHYIQRFLDEGERLLKKLVPKRGSPEAKPKKKSRVPMRASTPKFLRLSVLHDVLFYLVRDYTGDTISSHEDLLRRLEATCTIDEETRNDMPRLYLDHVSCYMFTPPLSDIHEKTPGWCGLMEVVLQAPLSSVCALISDRSMNLEMSSYLDHPIRQHYPISMVSLPLRQHLLSHKNFYHICCDVRRLCFMGLVKLGLGSNPRRLIGSALYINQRASIIDTTSSAVGYMHVEKNRDYPVTPYFFRVIHDVKIYWIDLFNICHQTRLGFGRAACDNLDKGKEFDQEALIASLQAVTNEEAIAKDDGSIPGDHLGAGGLHSFMYSFIFSNWMADVKKKKKTKRSKPSAVARRAPMKKRPVKTIRSMRLDETDREALMQMNKMRVNWSAKEDTILAMCKVGTVLLCRNARGKIRVKSSDIRAALRRHAGPECLDKTQLSIMRRMIYMGRMERWPSLGVITQMTRSLPEADRFLSPFAHVGEVKTNSLEAKVYMNKLGQTFHELVDFLVDRYVEDGIIVPLQEMTLPDTIEEFHEIYDVSEKTSKLTLKRIKEDSIRAVVLSSLSSTADKTSLVAQLLLVYRQFEGPLLRKAVKNLHRQHVIAVQRNHEGKKKTFLFGNCSYHFSQRFTQLLNTKFSQSVYHNAYAELNRLLCCVNDNPVEMNLVNCGPAIFPLGAMNLVSLSVSVPEQFVVLDTKLFPAETSCKIMKRYEELMNHPNPTSLLLEEEVPAKRIKLEPEDEAMDLDTDDVELLETSSKFSEAPVGIKSARIALMILREIAIREVEPNRAIRKPIDICVVSTSKVFIKPNLADLVKEYGISDGKAVKSILQTIYNRSNFLLHQVDEQSTLEKIIAEEENCQDVAYLLEIISAAGVKGSTVRELRTFGPNAGSLVRKLEKAGLVLKVGVEDVRFVSRENAKAWSIKSYKLTRLEREKLHPKSFVVPLSLDSVYGQGDLLQSQCPLSESKSIQVVMRPWVRVDGSTNRRVLDRMLGSMLGYILCNPGVQCSAVIAKFSPAFSLSWVRELIDLLESIGCVKQFTYRLSKPTLFSGGSVELVDHLDGLEDNDEILIEPKIDATVKLGQFIGNKSYAKDMLT